MKKIFASLLLVMLLSTSAFAAFGKNGLIPGAEPLVYRGLKIGENGVSVTFVNKGDKEIKLSCVLTFLDVQRKEVGDTYIENIVVPPNDSASLKNNYLKGDPRSCRKADSLRWMIYSAETK
ncbi:MAG: hypothetical protein Q4E17_04710 [Synergistes sp.]|nr:hypothetical protein [Synergistes sp.]